MELAQLQVSTRHQRQVGQVMQLAIVAVFVVGALNRNVSIVVNALIALSITFLPAILERDYRIPLNPALSLWITLAVLLHAVGMLGLYTTVWWWDHVTHTLSATIVAGVGYTTARVLDKHRAGLSFPQPFLFVFVLTFTLAFGVFWEVIEFAVHGLAEAYGFGPVLIQYSLEDTIEDLLFDLVGAVLVAVFGTRTLADFADRVAMARARVRDVRRR
ncbi:MULTISPECIES: hypothetical protein [unclassified Haladaptatus]|uniref:hypothetical protein n=1 Tax=unclassified Haladaptatus TaxID=2622732 RepID=UPI0023E8B266|nr:MULTISPECIES: hypothetical protein [unclassified Haladaptatus]